MKYENLYSDGKSDGPHDSYNSAVAAAEVHLQGLGPRVVAEVRPCGVYNAPMFDPRNRWSGYVTQDGPGRFSVRNPMEDAPGFQPDAIPALSLEPGKEWKQPDRRNIQVYDEWAFMNWETFKELKESSEATPVGPGVMWKKDDGLMPGLSCMRLWSLCWYDAIDESGSHPIRKKRLVTMQPLFQELMPLEAEKAPAVAEPPQADERAQMPVEEVERLCRAALKEVQEESYLHPNGADVEVALAEAIRILLKYKAATDQERDAMAGTILRQAEIIKSLRAQLEVKT